MNKMHSRSTLMSQGTFRWMIRAGFLLIVAAAVIGIWGIAFASPLGFSNPALQLSNSHDTSSAAIISSPNPHNLSGLKVFEAQTSLSNIPIPTSMPVSSDQVTLTLIQTRQIVASLFVGSPPK